MGKSSTRMLITSLLGDYNILENRGIIMLERLFTIISLKLIKILTFFVIKTSMNAINYLENTSTFKIRHSNYYRYW